MVILKADCYEMTVRLLKNHLEKYEWNITDMRGKIGKEVTGIYI